MIPNRLVITITYKQFIFWGAIPGMPEPSLRDTIIKLDRSIRSVSIVNNRGEVIEEEFKQGIEPLLNGADAQQQMYIH